VSWNKQSIGDLFSARVLIPGCLHEEPHDTLAARGHLETQRQTVWLYYLQALYVHLLYGLETFIRTVYHTHKANARIYVKIGFASGIETVFIITLDLTSAG
jgi:hypothetical protein